MKNIASACLDIISVEPGNKIVFKPLAGVLFSLLTYFLGIFGFIYLIAVIIADAVFIASLAVFGRSAKESQNFSKLAMILGLVAFTVGGIV